MTDNRFIGSGMIFPIELNSHGRPSIYKDLDLIKSSIAVILSWPQRSRFFNEDFGSRLEELIEEPSDAVSKSLLRRFIIDSINKWEKRVELISINIENNSPTVFNVTVNYKVRKTKQQDSFIFPFYQEIKY